MVKRLWLSQSVCGEERVGARWGAPRSRQRQCFLNIYRGRLLWCSCAVSLPERRLVLMCLKQALGVSRGGVKPVPILQA